MAPPARAGRPNKVGMCPHSRFVRLALGEYGLEVRQVRERAWERREEFLILNPAGTVPVLVTEGLPPVPGGAIIAEYLDESLGSELGDQRLLPHDPYPRVEVRRLMSWFLRQPTCSSASVPRRRNSSGEQSAKPESPGFLGAAPAGEPHSHQSNLHPRGPGSPTSAQSRRRQMTM
jgi:glutathione S-transferase